MTPYPLPQTPPRPSGFLQRLSGWLARRPWKFSLLILLAALLLLAMQRQKEPAPAHKPALAHKDARTGCDDAVEKMSPPIAYATSDGWCPPTPVAVFKTEATARAFSRNLADKGATQVGIVVRLETNHNHSPARWNQVRAEFIRRACSADGFLSYFDDDDAFSPHAAVTGNDPLHDTFNAKHWKMLELDSTPVQATAPRSRVVAVIDEGTAKHPDLYVSARYKIVDINQADNQCIADVCCPVAPDSGGSAHANMVAGAIGASSGNSIGIRGLIDTNVNQLKSIRVKRSNTSCMRRDDVVAGVRCASELHADVINMSIGTDKPSEPLGLLLRYAPGPDGLMLFHYVFDPQAREKALKEAVEKAGAATPPALVVASAGNQECQLNELGTRCYSWPGSLELDNVITAEARNQDGTIDSSNYGTAYVDLAVRAPRIHDAYCSTNSQPEPHSYTGKCENGYAPLSESSAAAAIVSGASVLVLNHPNYQNCTPAQLRDVLIEHGSPYTPVDRNNQPEPVKTACMLKLGFLATVKNDDATGLALDQCANHKRPLGCGKPAP